MAFIRGPGANDEAEERFAVYRQSLEAAGIAYLDKLVVSGNFEPSGGRDAVRTLLTERGLAVDDVDAIVAANDAMALGALEMLASLGIAAPHQVAVVGFDDVEEARFALPSLTTVRQPLYEQGRAAVRLVLEKLDGVKRHEALRLGSASRPRGAEAAAVHRRAARRGHRRWARLAPPQR